MDKMKTQEYQSIIQPALEIDEYLKLKDMKHHGISRYEHSLRVARNTYRITRALHLNYEEATFAAVLHDFFTTEVKKVNVFKKLSRHPRIALNNSKKYFDLSDLQEDIILTHMFPCTIRPPKYLESWIVDIIDDGVALYEWGTSYGKKIAAGAAVIVQFIQLR